MKKLFTIAISLCLCYSLFAQEVIQGVILRSGQLQPVMLYYYNGNITHYATQRNYMGDYDWKSMYPDSPHPTNSYQDPQMYRSYGYKVNAGSVSIYFNLASSRSNPLNSYAGNSRYGNNYGTGGSSNYGAQEKIVQGVFFQNGHENVIVLRFYGGKVMNYATSQGYTGYNWQSVSAPDNPHPTNAIQDGNVARYYNSKVSIGRTTVYFNQ